MKLNLIIMGLLLVIPFCSATTNLYKVFTPTEAIYSNSTSIRISSFCLDNTNSICGTDVNCTVSIYYSNFSLLVNKQWMVQDVDSYFYDLSPSQTAQTGNYNGLIRCNNTYQTKTSTFTYIVSTTGNTTNDDVENIPASFWNTSSLVSPNLLNQIAIEIWNYIARYTHGVII